MLQTWILTAYLGSFVADAGSTHYFLAHGAREARLTQSAWTNDAILAGEAAGYWWITDKVAKTHPKLATILRLGVAGHRYHTAMVNLE